MTLSKKQLRGLQLMNSSMKGMRTSLTFRHLLTNPVYPPPNKPKLQVEDSQLINCTMRDSSTDRDIPSTNSVCEKN